MTYIGFGLLALTFWRPLYYSIKYVYYRFKGIPGDEYIFAIKQWFNIYWQLIIWPTKSGKV